MATCLLCHFHAPDEAAVCPACGGALERDDPTRVADAGATVAFGPGRTTPGDDPTRVSNHADQRGRAEAGANLGPGNESPGTPWGPPSGEPRPAPPSAAAWGPPGGIPYQAAPPGPGGWGPPAGQAGWMPPFVAAPPTNALAIWSLCTSIAGLALGPVCFFPVLACPVGAILGHISLSQIRRSGEQGRGLALAGVIVGWLATALVVLFIVLVGAILVGSGSST